MNETKISIKKTGEVILSIGRTRRNIGTLNDRILYQNKSKAKHYFRMFGGYGFPYELIAEHSNEFDLVSLCIDYRDFYYISPVTIMQKGIIKKFGEYENQIFVNQKYLSLKKEQAIDFAESLNPAEEKQPESIQTLLFA